MDTTITTLEMCAGYGGIGLGIKNIFGERLRTIAYCELEGFAQANLISKMEKGLLDAAPIWSDLKTFPYESFHGLVDILIAGYPCQPFSSAGKRAGKEDPRHLWPWIADGIRLLQPTMCFFENVEGHISLGLSTVISDLEELGYKVSWGIFSAREVGAPHQRKRIFIMAHRSGERLQGGKWCWKTRAQGESSGHFAECGSSMADSIMRGMSRSRNELGDSCEAGQGGKNPSQNSNDGNKEFMANSSSNGYNWWKLQDRMEGWASGELPQPHAGESCGLWSEAIGCGQVWPSRPGQQQHAWEPPRVVGNSKYSGLATKQVIRSDEASSDDWRTQEQEQTRQSSGADRPINVPSIQGSPDGGESEAVGNAECLCIPASREHGTMDEASGIPTDRKGSEPAQTDPESSATREREGDGGNAAECSKIECEVGRDAYGTEFGMDLSELSGLSHQELAEICDWMVKTESRTDELRLLGNGVVPATATRAFLTLIEELNK